MHSNDNSRCDLGHLKGKCYLHCWLCALVLFNSKIFHISLQNSSDGKDFYAGMWLVCVDRISAQPLELGQTEEEKCSNKETAVDAV